MLCMRHAAVLAVVTLALVGCRAPEPDPRGPAPVQATTVKPRPLVVECDRLLPCFTTTTK